MAIVYYAEAIRLKKNEFSQENFSDPPLGKNDATNTDQTGEQVYCKSGDSVFFKVHNEGNLLLYYVCDPDALNQYKFTVKKGNSIFAKSDLVVKREEVSNKERGFLVIDPAEALIVSGENKGMIRIDTWSRSKCWFTLIELSD